MNTGTLTKLFACGALLALVSGRARGELIELTNGQVLQGDIDDGRTNDDGLAVDVYDTGGTVVLRWDHIVEPMRKDLRVRFGIERPTETVELIDGHRVLLNSGTWIYGIAENPRDDQPLRMKQLGGTRQYDRSMLAGKVEDVQIDGLRVYTPEELYQIVLAKNPPETAAAHKILAERCINIGAFDRAKEHLAACKADAAFMATPEGKAVEGMDRLDDVLIRAKGASDLKRQIEIAEAENRWNDALKMLTTLNSTYQDDAIRKAIRYDLLEAYVVKGRTEYMEKQIAVDLYKVVDALIEKKARERKKAVADPDNPPKPGSADPGTLAAARQWMNKELPNLMWDQVGSDLGITSKETKDAGDQLQTFWKNRKKILHRASYNTGSFIVVKRAPPPKASGPAPSQNEKQRRTPSERPNKGNKNQPEKPAQVEKPLTDEEWWDQVGSSDRRNWLMAAFAEQGGWFEVARADQANCADCSGTGLKKTQNSSGDEEQHFCKTCNGCGVVRVVNYR